MMLLQILEHILKKEVQYYSQYESALIISEAERKAWDDARNARIDAQNDRDAKREARDVVLAEYKKYEERKKCCFCAGNSVAN